MEQRKLNNITSLWGIAAVFIIVHHYSTFLIPEIKQFTSAFTPLISKNCILVDFLLSIKTTYLGRGRGSRLLP